MNVLYTCLGFVALYIVFCTDLVRGPVSNYFTRKQCKDDFKKLQLVEYFDKHKNSMELTKSKLKIGNFTIVNDNVGKQRNYFYREMIKRYYDVDDDLNSLQCQYLFKLAKKEKKKMVKEV